MPKLSLMTCVMQCTRSSNIVLDVCFKDQCCERAKQNIAAAAAQYAGKSGPTQSNKGYKHIAQAVHETLCCDNACPRNRGGQQ
jgi:hypothetical protein